MLLTGTLCLGLSAAAWSQENPAIRLYQEGLAARNAGQTDAAVERFGELVRIEPENADARLQLGLALAAQRRYAAAARELKRVLEQTPDYHDARLGLARIAFWQGDLASAERELRALRKRAPDHPEANRLAQQVTAAAHSRWLEEARALRRRQHFEEAERVFRRLLARHPRDADLWVDIGMVLAFQNRVPEARAAFERALALNPDLVDAELGLVRVDLAAKAFDAAEAGIGRVLERRPDDRDARALEARILLARGDAASAEQAFQRLVEDLPGEVEAQIGLGDSLRAQERDEEARDVYLRASHTDPHSAQVQERLALKPRPRWRVDIDGSLSRLTEGLAPWHEGRIGVGYRLNASTTLSAGLEISRRFKKVDVLIDGRIDRRWSKTASTYLRIGGTPDADVRPELLVETGGAFQVAPGTGVIGPAVATLDVGFARYRTGKVVSASPGLQQYVFDGQFWLTARMIGVISETGEPLAGYLVRADWLLAERWNIFLGYADAPTTIRGRTMDTQALFGGVSLPLDEQTTMRVSASREDQELAYDRTTVNVGVTSRF